MAKQLKTMNLKGNEYAQVADRLKAFREDCPFGSIKTTHVMNPDGSVVFSAYIIKDKRDEYSADATGTSMMSADKIKNEKQFEKGETVAVGRALALLGYLGSGEIASSDEMQEFEQFKADRHQVELDNAIKTLKNAQTMDELKRVFMALPASTKAELNDLKDEIKTKLTQKEAKNESPEA